MTAAYGVMATLPILFASVGYARVSGQGCGERGARRND